MEISPSLSPSPSRKGGDCHDFVQVDNDDGQGQAEVGVESVAVDQSVNVTKMAAPENEPQGKIPNEVRVLPSPSRKRADCHDFVVVDNDNGQGQDEVGVESVAVDQSGKVTKVAALENVPQDKTTNEIGVPPSPSKRLRLSAAGGDTERKAEVDSDGDVDMASVDSFNFESSDSEMEDIDEDENGHNSQNVSSTFDVNRIVESIASGEPVLDQVQGRDVVLVVGKTGTGKSTLIQAIAGRAFRETKYYTNLATAAKVVYEAVDPLPGFEIGHAQMSKTANIGCYDPGTPGSLLYIDTPGFEDTNGQEADIATSVMLSEVAKRCRSLRFIIMISYVSLLEDRGGAMRSVLRLIRSFAKDFSKEKQSFMFLFTHSNKISDMQNSNKGADFLLQDDIIRTIEGTSDGETKEILEHIRKCLKKKYPFAKLFLPLKTDIREIRFSIKSHLKPGKESPHIASSCGLTQLSRLTLNGHLKTRFQELRRNLAEVEPKMDKVCVALNMFQYFARYISIEDVRSTVRDVDGLLRNFISEHIKSIDNELKRGTSSEHDFGPANVKTVEGNLTRLRALSQQYHEHIDCESIILHINDEVTKFQKQLMLRPGKNFIGMHRQLAKMEAWSIEFPQFKALYQGTVDHLAHFIRSSMKASDAMKGNQVLALDSAQLEDSIQNLWVLWSIHENAESLCCHIPNAHVAADFFQSVLSKLKSVVNRWTDKVKKKCKRATRDEKSLLSFADFLAQIESLNNSLEKYPICSDLKATIEKLRKRLIEETIESFNIFASQSDIGSKDRLPQNTQSILVHIFRASKLFIHIENGLGTHIRSLYNTLVFDVKSYLMKCIGEMNEIAHVMEQQGLRNGTRDAKFLTDLRSFCWFDDVVPEAERFVKNICIKFERQYHDKIENLRSKVHHTFHEIEDQSIDSESSVAILRHILPELQHISNFGQVIKKEYLIEAETKNRLEKSVGVFIGRAKADAIHWDDIMHNNKSDVQNVKEATNRLERVLREINVLKGIDPQCDVELSLLQSHIVQQTNHFSNRVENVMKSSENYDEKLHFFRITNTLQNYSIVNKNLTGFQRLKDLARNSVARDAKLIEDLVSETSEWDDIDILLSKFQGATILDNFTSNEASSRIRPLLQLRAKKQEEVDNLLEQLIDDEDFKGIHNFLIPYAKSKDQVQKQKFDKWRSLIDSSLSTAIGAITHDIQGPMTTETYRRVVGELEKLDLATMNLKQYFNNSDGLNLEKEVRTVRMKINDKLVSTLANFDEAWKKLDYEAMGISNHFISTYDAHLNHYISNQNAKRVRATQRKYRNARNNIAQKMVDFFDYGFKNDNSDFLHILPSLKNASESGFTYLEDLTEIYVQTCKSLTNQINQLFSDINSSVSKSNDYEYGIDAMYTLNYHLSRSLKDHVDFSKILFDGETQIVEWRKEKQEIERKLDFDGRDAEEKLEQWKTLMEKLHPSKNVVLRKYRQWASGTSYQRKVEQIERMVSDRFSKGKKALNDSNHSLVNESIKVLDLIERYLGRHVKGAGQKSTTLMQSSSEIFLDLCGRAQIILQSEDKMQFEGMFFDYRGLILEVPCVMEYEPCKKAFALTNQLVHDALESDMKDISTLLEAFDYETLKTKIRHARKFGGFVADECSLLRECIKSCDHMVDDDPWLEKIFSKSIQAFSHGRNLSKIKYFAILELKPSAKKKDINKAYKRLAKKFHPDKTGSNDSEMFRRIQEAKEVLLAITSSIDEKPEKPFGAIIKGIRSNLRQKVKVYLEQQRYELVKKILFKLGDLKALKSLVTPALDNQEITDEIHELVRSHVQQVKINVDSNWSSKQYCALNDTITDLKLMENNFKSYNNIFPSSWDDGGIVRKVELEIESLGTRAREYLSSEVSAQKYKDDFRRCFLNMGHVLVELPLFKACTKDIMCNVLEACLRYNWGYSFLFDFGLGLQRGDKSDSDKDSHVAQILVAEFSHFKEVMTMVWNEETSQKPVEDTVRGIKGQHRTAEKNEELSIDEDRLLQSFEIFDAEYKKLLGEYIDPEADLKKLVSKTNTLVSTFLPINCTSEWSQELKNQIPKIIAAVFTIFTVLKSGASYNRLGSENNDTNLGQKLLMKPHNIQVLTLLTLFGCGSASSTTGLDSHLMQIRTGEGKSMILGAAAVVLALLGFRAHCVCYSEYLSNRDYNLFQDVFDIFSVAEFVKYSKITSLSEDTTARKGDIRSLTESLLRGHLKERTIPKSEIEQSIASSSKEGAISKKEKSTKKVKLSRKKQDDTPVNNTFITSNRPSCDRKEILLVDEVDVFFGADFYGQTYNQVTQLREPEISSILNHIWNVNKRHGRRQRLADIRKTEMYSQLVAKMPQFKFLIDAEIAMMLDQVRKVDEEPYYLNKINDRIGYRIMDSISYEATYGYRTVFAYLQEADRGNLKDRDSTLAKALAMPVSCGQFSYANISPERILGVSGTLSALGEYEYNILSKYGVDKFMYVPSVYGESNFDFDRAGEGIRIDTSKSDYFHSITDQIQTLTKKGKKRSVIVFFENNARLKEFTDSSFYRKLGRNKKLLTENLNAGEKEFVISKAATSGQITISTAVFGRGTDFFCRDETLQKNGGVHIIQTFLSKEQSEEIQIQGRTARQGKKGSYQMILLDTDLADQFGFALGTKDSVPKDKWYQELCSSRDKSHKERCETIEENLIEATRKDKNTHLYFDHLLAQDKSSATKQFKEIYTSFKKGSMPSSIELDLAFLLDVTGSMAPYAKAIVTTVNSLLLGSDSIAEKLKLSFPDIDFHLRVGVLGYRDIDDESQFNQTDWQGNGHFTKDISNATCFVKTLTENSFGGGDIAEDHLGAINQCANWNSEDDWTSQIKFMLLLTDAPAHGMVPAGSEGVPNSDNYAVRHPSGLTAKSIITSLIQKDIDLFICSFNPNATAVTEKELAKAYASHSENIEQREITSIAMVPAHQELIASHSDHGRREMLGHRGKHIVFVLDQSGSMSFNWAGVVIAYNQYLERRKQNQSESDLVSVVQFDGGAHISVSMAPIGQAPTTLSFSGGGTAFHPAAVSASSLVSGGPSTHTPLVVFMSDGCAYDANSAADTFAQLNLHTQQTHGSDLELHVIAFGDGADTEQLQLIANSSCDGKLHESADTTALSNIFVEIAGGGSVVDKLEAEIGKRISDAVSDRLSIEYTA